MPKKSVRPLHPNSILAALPPEELVAMLRHLAPRPLEQGAVLYDSGKKIREVCFPHSGMVGITKTMSGGERIGTALIGPEGVVGFPLVLGADRWPGSAIVQVPGEGSCMPAGEFLRIVQQCPTLTRLLHCYLLALINQIAQSSACHRIHSVELRCAHWLLMSHDRVQSNSFVLTQEFLAEMLGVQRPTVSLAAVQLQRAGMIRYARGKISITDRRALEGATCECYRVVRHEYERLLGTVWHSDR